MKKLKGVFGLAVFALMIAGWGQLTVTPVRGGVMPACVDLCPTIGGWCMGQTTHCWQYCNGTWVMLNCNQVCGAHC